MWPAVVVEANPVADELPERDSELVHRIMRSRVRSLGLWGSRPCRFGVPRKTCTPRRHGGGESVADIRVLATDLNAPVSRRQLPKSGHIRVR